jgi:hypothetical protein
MAGERYVAVHVLLFVIIQNNITRVTLRHCVMQDVLQDRREVYRLLQENGIAVPMHIVVNRDGLEAGEDPPGFVEEVRCCFITCATLHLPTAA